MKYFVLNKNILIRNQLILLIPHHFANFYLNHYEQIYFINLQNHYYLMKFINCLKAIIFNY